MARTVQEIQDAIIAEKETHPELDQFDTTSQTSVWRLWTFVFAVIINAFEQLNDIFKQEVQDLVDTSRPGTFPWWLNEVFKFQYSLTNPQNIELIDFVPTYAVVDPALRIISRASVLDGGDKIILIKVAKNEPPEPLDTLELDAFEDYTDTIHFAGTEIQIRSVLPDLLQVVAEVFYDGAFSANIVANVETALTDYLINLSNTQNFDGTVFRSEIIEAIKGAEGVNDVDINDLKARPDATPIGGAVDIDRAYNTFAGYIIEESTPGFTFADTLTYTIGT